MSSLPPALRERASRVRLLVLDVDGVLTDGRLVYGNDGEQLKVFHVRDGLGLRMLQHFGVEIAVITARRSAALLARMRDLKIEAFMPGRDDKLAALDELLRDRALTPEDVAFMGDDILDLPVMQRVGLAISVPDGHPLARARAHWVTAERGGNGAVREVCDGLLELKIGLEAAVDQFLGRAISRSELEKA